MAAMNRNLCTIAAMALALMLSNRADAARMTADAQFKALYTREWKWRQQQTTPDHLPHVDEKAQMSELAYWQDVMKKLND